MRRVAVTGWGVISPAGNGADNFFANLLAARSGLAIMDVNHYVNPDQIVAGRVAFDATEHFTRMQLITMDPTAQFAVVAAREALAQAGLADAQARGEAIDPDRFGIAIGTGMGGSGSVDAAYTFMFEGRAPRARPMTVVLGMNNGITAQLGLAFGLRGPSTTVSNACASAATAIGDAVRSIRHGYADAMLVGGSEALLNRGTIKAWQAMQTLAKPHPDGAEASCRPFSADRSGLVLAEGAGVLVLEAWEVAQRRGATILAELAGFGSSTDAHHLTQPHAPGQARAMRLALADAGLQPQDIGYLNAHGTATEVGDVVESEAIALAFGDAAGQLAVSSTKALHGHTLGAAGAIELIASLMALRNKQLPPTAFLDTPDPRCTLDYIPHTARPAPGLRAIMSNSFAFGGSNAVLVAKEASA